MLVHHSRIALVGELPTTQDENAPGRERNQVLPCLSLAAENKNSVAVRYFMVPYTRHQYLTYLVMPDLKFC